MCSLNTHTMKKSDTSINHLFWSLNHAGLLLVSVAAIALYSCNSSSGNQSAQMAAQPPALPVFVIAKTEATTFQDYSASLEGSKDIEIRPQVEGYLEKIFVDEGAQVKAGQPLFQINSRPFHEQLNNAKAALSAAKANLSTAEINVSKLTPLVQNNVISDVQLKTAKSAYDAAAASVQQAEATVNNAQINLGYALIKAPVSGYIGRIPHKMGSYVNTSTAEALTVLSEIKEVYAYFSMSENDFLQFKQQFEGNTVEEKIKKIPPVELVLSDGSVYAQKGKVQMVTGQFDNNTGAISFRATFPNVDRLLRSGNTGKIRIPRVRAQTLVVPQEATFEIQDKVFVFAVGDSNKVSTKPILISGKTASYYFVDSGVQEGEKIVFSGAGNLKDGMAIVPQPMSTDSLYKAKPLQ